MRIEAWEAPWIEFVERETVKPFSWERDNCVSLAYENIKILRGSFDEPFVASWADEKSAKAALKKIKFKTLSDAFAAYLEEIPPSMAGRGDIGIIDNGVLICIGQLFVGRDNDGRCLRGLHQIQRAFRV